MGGFPSQPSSILGDFLCQGVSSAISGYEGDADRQWEPGQFSSLGQSGCSPRRFHCFIGETVKCSCEGQYALVPWPDLEVDEPPLSSILAWVLQKIEMVSGVLGLSFDGLEHLAWELFAELKKRATV